MQQFTVPQFIDVEDKIIGPITTRQFIILLFTGLLIFVLFKILTFVPFVIVGLILFGIGGIVAFIRINGQPFHFFMLNFLQTLRYPSVQIWDKTLTEMQLRARREVAHPVPQVVAPRKEAVTASRLSEIALMVDTGGAYTPEG